MRKIKHYTTQGHAHFITLVINKRMSVFLNSETARKAIQAIEFYQKNLFFKILGYVIMPDHIHLIVWPEGKKTLEEFVRDFKKYLAQEILHRVTSLEKTKILLERPQKRNHRFQIWQKGYYDFNIYNQETLNEKLSYMHNNPVRKRLVENPEDYPYSSCRDYMEKGEVLLKVDRI